LIQEQRTTTTVKAARSREQEKGEREWVVGMLQKLLSSGGGDGGRGDGDGGRGDGGRGEKEKALLYWFYSLIGAASERVRERERVLAA
jgi:hypothetical protein